MNHKRVPKYFYHLSTCLKISLSSSEKLQFGHYTIHILWHKLSLHTTIWSVIYELWKWAILHVNWHHKLVIKKVLRIWIVQHQKANWCNLYWASHAGNFPRKQAALSKYPSESNYLCTHHSTTGPNKWVSTKTKGSSTMISLENFSAQTALSQKSNRFLCSAQLKRT